MKITKISLRQELARAIMDVAGIKEWDIQTFTDDDLIAQALIMILRCNTPHGARWSRRDKEGGMRMTMKEIMNRRHGGFNGRFDNGGIYFDMEDFWLKTKDGLVKIEVVDDPEDIRNRKEGGDGMA